MELINENGAPRNGTLADIRRSTRAQYHYAIRHAQKVKDQRIANKLATKVFNSRPNEFWNNVRRMKGNFTSLPNTIDRVTGSKNISELFASKYRDLYNSVPYMSKDNLQI